MSKNRSAILLSPESDVVKTRNRKAQIELTRQSLLIRLWDSRRSAFIQSGGDAAHNRITSSATDCCAR